MLVSIVAGSDKTVVSVATGQQEFHPMYVSPGNIDNPTRRAHGIGIVPCAFLPIPKGIILMIHISFDVYGSLLFCSSWSEGTNNSRIPMILLATISCLSCLCLHTSQACDDISGGRLVSRWTFLPCNILNWTLHC